MNWGTMSRAERDAAYNNSEAVADSPALNAAREVASAAFRAAHPEHLDLRYGPRERNTWDLFPAADPKAPCLVFIHGGYWQRNSKDLFANLIAGPYAHGWAAALPGYTLCAGRDADRDRCRDQCGARLAGRTRAGTWHHRSGRAVGLVGGWPSDRDGPGSSAVSSRVWRYPASSSWGRCATPISTISCV